MRLKIMTFNIRYDNPADGINRFAGRRDMISAFLRREAPDLIGFQESVPVIRHALAEDLPEYEFLAMDVNEVLHNDVMIAYRRDRFDLMTLDQFWLSRTPRVPHSRYPDQCWFGRMATLVTLVERSEAREVTLLNSHLDHIGEGARQEGARLLCETVRPYLEGAAFITGDFNAVPSAPAAKIITAVTPMQDLTAPLGEGVATCHDYGRIKEDLKIDYIFASPSVKPIAGTLVMHTDECDGVYLSDHYPISIEVEV